LQNAPSSAGTPNGDKDLEDDGDSTSDGTQLLPPHISSPLTAHSAPCLWRHAEPPLQPCDHSNSPHHAHYLTLAATGVDMDYTRYLTPLTSSQCGYMNHPQPHPLPRQLSTVNMASSEHDKMYVLPIVEPHKPIQALALT